MAIDDYKEALKLGQKAYREAVGKGSYPYLTALDNFIRQDDIATEMNLGLVEIPMDRIIGTKTAGRTKSFAHNFMPILEANTEFAMKWMVLCDSLIEDGLRDPIKAYEFMNYYYVLEGNKRVSVMKYYGADSIPGTVIRIVPKRTNTKENQVYYEYMKFNRMSGVNYIFYKEPGSYDLLQAAVGKGPEECWDADEKKDFHTFYVRFKKAYENKGLAKKAVGVDTAILVYLNIYPYEEAKNHLAVDFKANLTRSQEEFLVPREEAVELSMNPSELPKKNIFTKLITDTTKTAISYTKAPKIYKIAFIYDKSVQTSGWTYAHELGRLHLEQMYGDRIKTTVYDQVDPTDMKASLEVIERAIKDGNEVVFTTTPKLLKASLKAAVDYPAVKILNCSVNTTHPHVRSYYGRMYEAKFILGAIAGAMSETDNIGYIADYPIYGMTANINAFALGARMVNPRAKVFLEWSTIKDRATHDNLKKNGAYFISDRDMIVPKYASRQFGLYHEDANIPSDEAVPENMATPVWHWGKFYELILRSVLSGNWKADEPSGAPKAVNYWWGMSAGVIDVICSKNLPVGTARLVRLLKKDIISGEFNPFSGVLYDQEGHIRHESDEAMRADEIIKMDWLVQNVVGTIPTMDELTEEAKQIVAVQGVESAKPVKDTLI